MRGLVLLITIATVLIYRGARTVSPLGNGGGAGQATWEVAQHENAVGNCAGPHIRIFKPPTLTWTECEAACKADPKCNVWTWKSAVCSLRTDGAYYPLSERGVVSGFKSHQHAWDQDAARFRKYVERIQHPPRCDSRARDWGGWKFGLGSQLHVMRNTMLFTLHKNESLVWSAHTTKYISRKRCAAQDFSCVFQEISGCKNSSATPLLPAKFPSGHPEGPYDQICPGFTGTLFRNRAGLRGHYPIAFYTSLLMEHIMRPNADLLAFRLKIKRELGFNASTTIGLHVRHGDKKEGVRYQIKQYADAIRCLASLKGYRTVFVGSDNPKVVPALKARTPPPDTQRAQLFPVPSHCPRACLGYLERANAVPTSPGACQAHAARV